jgi:hypothetical protein
VTCGEVLIGLLVIVSAFGAGYGFGKARTYIAAYQDGYDNAKKFFVNCKPETHKGGDAE